MQDTRWPNTPPRRRAPRLPVSPSIDHAARVFCLETVEQKLGANCRATRRDPLGFSSVKKPSSRVFSTHFSYRLCLIEVESDPGANHDAVARWLSVTRDPNPGLDRSLGRVALLSAVNRDQRATLRSSLRRYDLTVAGDERDSGNRTGTHSSKSRLSTKYQRPTVIAAECSSPRNWSTPVSTIPPTH